MEQKGEGSGRGERGGYRGVRKYGNIRSTAGRRVKEEGREGMGQKGEGSGRGVKG